MKGLKMEVEPFRMGIFGSSGFGKSYFIKNRLIPLLAKFKPVIIFDRKGEYGGPLAKDVPQKWKAFRGFKGFLKALQDPKLLNYKLKAEPYVIVCSSDSDYIQGIKFFHEMGNPVSLILEEVYDLLKHPDFKETKNRIIQLARHGRHEKIDIALISQRGMDLHPDVRSQLNSFITFRQMLKSDVDMLKEAGAPDPDLIFDLDKRNYLIFGEVPTHIKELEN
jgi:hypothetical protein